MRRLRSHRYVKRIYAALMISSLVCQLQVIVVSTVALERLSRPYDKEVSVESFMRRYFDLEWIAVRLNFFVGVLSFVGTSVCEYACLDARSSDARHRSLPSVCGLGKRSPVP